MKRNKDYPLLLENSYQIRSYDTDAKGCAKLTSLIHYLMESAWNHAKLMELGFYDLKKENLLWVLSRFRIELSHFPEWQESIKIQTWAKGMDKLFALRDFLILDESNKVLGAATSGWLVIDYKKRKPQRPDLLFKDKSLLKDKNAIYQKLTKISPLKDPHISPYYPVLYSDIDLNGHVNSIKYIQWIIDSYSYDILNDFQIRSIEINFINELYYGNEYAIGTEVIKGNQEYLNHIKRVDDKIVCRAKISWGK